MTVLYENARAGEAVMSEGARAISRENVVIAISQSIAANALLAAMTVVAGAVVTQSYAGTGNGILTLANPAISSKAKDGDYKVVFIEPAANGGTFEVRDPSGKSIGTGVVGTAFNKEVKFTIADGATDFIAGDTFTISVAADAEDTQYVAYNPAGTDGSEIPAAYSIYAVTTDGTATKKTAVLTRMCELNGNCIAWPDGITATQKADAVQALASRNIIVRF